MAVDPAINEAVALALEYRDQANISAISASNDADNSLASAIDSASNANLTLAQYNLAVAAANAAQTSQNAISAIFSTIADKYLGSYSTAPIERPDFTPLQAGDLYWDTTLSSVQFYNGSTWDSPDASAAASAQQALDSATSANDSAASAALSATSATNSATSAAQNRDLSAQDAAIAQTAANNAGATYTSVQAYYGMAETSADNAYSAQIAAEHARDLANDWADSATAIVTGRFSAKYWAEQAVTTVANVDTTIGNFRDEYTFDHLTINNTITGFNSTLVTFDNALTTHTTVFNNYKTTNDNRVSAAETRISLLEGLDLDTVTTDLQNQLDILNVPAFLQVVADYPLIESKLDQNIDYTLNQLLAIYEANGLTLTDIAAVQNTLAADVNTARSASAIDRTELLAAINNNVASIDQINYVAADSTSAIAQQVASLNATVGNINASVADIVVASVGYATDVNGFLFDNNGTVLSEQDVIEWNFANAAPVPDPHYPLTWNTGLPVATMLSQLEVTDGTNTGTIDQLMTIHQNYDESLEAEITFKIDNNGRVSGFGLRSDTTDGSAFNVAADKISFVPSPDYIQETEPGFPVLGEIWYKESTNTYYQFDGIAFQVFAATSIFTVITHNQTFEGRSVTPGVYINKAYVGKLDANQIDVDTLIANNEIIVGGSTVLDLSLEGGTLAGMTISPDALRVGKTSSSDNVNVGFYLGVDGELNPSYDFLIGDSTNSLLWDGSAGTLTIKASIADGSDLNGTSISTVVDGAADGAAALAALPSIQTDISNKLDAGTTLILGGGLEFKTSGYDAGTGIAISSYGIVGLKNGVSEFTIDNYGDATFAGTLTAKSGTIGGFNIYSNGIYTGVGERQNDNTPFLLDIRNGVEFSLGSKFYFKGVDTGPATLTIVGDLKLNDGANNKIDILSTDATFKVYTADSGTTPVIDIGGTSKRKIYARSDVLTGAGWGVLDSVIISEADESLPCYGAKHNATTYDLFNACFYGTVQAGSSIKTFTYGVSSTGSQYGAYLYCNSYAKGAYVRTANTTTYLGYEGATDYNVYCSSGAGIYSPGQSLSFTGAHDALILNNVECEVGDILIVKSVFEKVDVSYIVYELTPSTASKQKSILGVASKIPTAITDLDMMPLLFISEVQVIPPVYDENGVVVEDAEDINIYREDASTITDTYNHIIANALGEGQLNVCGENGDIEIGDYICASNMRGKGMKQDDDILHSYTVAKALESVTFSSPNEVKMIACTYHCG